MRRHWGKVALMCGVAVVVLLHPTTTFECGPFLSVPVFVTQNPGNFDDFMGGNLGVIRSSFSKQNLFIAYRTLAGAPLTDVERTSLKTPLPQGANRYVLYTKKNLYLQERANIPGLPAAKEFVQYKPASDFQTYPNCGDDALRNAAETLHQRVKQFGSDSREVREWVLAQDQVFKNCGEEANSIPNPAPEDAAALLRADREYQIASAHFYAGNYDEAARLFQKIGDEKWSQWHDWGLYLAGRSFIRKATLKSDEDLDEKANLKRAEELLKRVAADPSLATIKPKAESLLEFIEFRLDPKKRAADLYQSLSAARADDRFNQHLRDYLQLMLENRAEADEMADWIMVVGGKEQGADAIERWKRERKSKAWLVAALIYANAKSAEASDLIEAAARVPEGSPAYATARYHLARLQAEGGDRDESRKTLDEFLNHHAKNLSWDTLNMFLALRTANAASLEDFAQFSERKVVALGGWDTGEDLCQDCPKPIPDIEASKVINHLSIDDLLALSRSRAASSDVRVTAARLAFTRSSIFNDDRNLKLSAEELSKLSQDLAKDLKRVIAARTSNERKTEAALTLLNWPGGSYRIDPGNARTFGIEKDPMRELVHLRFQGSTNWWCDQNEEAIPAVSDVAEGYPAFLSATQRKNAELQLRGLKKADAPPVFLGKVLLEWSKQSPDDARVPDVLQKLVRAVHYGCGGDAATRVGKVAFQRLHEKYPKSAEAKQTKYWYESPSF